MSFSGAVLALQAHARSLSGVREAPTTIPEGVAAFPFVVTYPREGFIEYLAEYQKGLHTVYTEFHCDRSILTTAASLAMGFITSFPNLLLQDPTLGGEVSTLILDASRPIKYTFGRMSWGGIETIGVRFEITFKLQEVLA